MTKQVQLSDEAYRVLKGQKRAGESFSKTVLRLANGNKDPRSFVGARLPGLDAEAHLRLVKQLRGPRL